MTKRTPWHWIFQMHDTQAWKETHRVTYRCLDGSDIAITGFDTLYIHTDRGTMYAPDVLDILDPAGFDLEVEAVA